MLGAFRLAGHCEAFLSGAAADLPSDVVQRAFRQLEPLYRLLNGVAHRVATSVHRSTQMGRTKPLDHDRSARKSPHGRNNGTGARGLWVV